MDDATKVLDADHDRGARRVPGVAAARRDRLRAGQARRGADGGRRGAEAERRQRRRRSSSRRASTSRSASAAKAVEAAQKAVKAQPANGLAYHTLALAQAASGNNALALSAAKDAVARAPMLADAVFLLAELQLQAGDTVGASRGSQGLPREAAEGPARLGGARQGAAAHARRGRGARRRSRRRSSSLRRARAGRTCVGLALRAQGKPAEAKQQFEKALAMAPGFTRAARAARHDELRREEPAGGDRAHRAPGAARAEVGGAPVPARPRLPGERRHEAGREGLPEGDRAQPAGGAGLREPRADLRRVEGVRPRDRRARQGARRRGPTSRRR